MSRAFVREIDDAPEPPPVERAVSAAPNLVTPRGARTIDENVAALEAALAFARGEEEARLRRDLRYWTARRASARVMAPDPHPTEAGFGTKVTIRRGILMSDLLIVGEDEADPAKGRIAWTAPLARALEGAERGDVVELEAGGRIEEVRVFAVGPGED
ncbi:MAG TPA: GreA/GreB family elongation factor [Allosphingosinicella sp.]|nr:GreA/GreB family elongation factor [Allosphingosinicella sp.]